MQSEQLRRQLQITRDTTSSCSHYRSDCSSDRPFHFPPPPPCSTHCKVDDSLQCSCYCCSAVGWRLGLQAVTVVVFLTFILGTFYRSASLYHPQRRAILHLKNQKRKIKDKNKVDDKLPFFDFSTLRSKTVRILLVSTGISSFGINTPIFYLVSEILSVTCCGGFM